MFSRQLAVPFKRARRLAARLVVRHPRTTCHAGNTDSLRRSPRDTRLFRRACPLHRRFTQIPHWPKTTLVALSDAVGVRLLERLAPYEKT